MTQHMLMQEGPPSSTIPMSLDNLRADLERLFEVGDLQRLAKIVLGEDSNPPSAGDDAKGTLVNELVERCAERDAIEALGDAIVVLTGSKPLRLDSAGSVARLAAGARVGPYVIEKRLGSGGLGTVYLAWQGERPVRLKLLGREVTANKSALQRFFTLSRLSAELEHPSRPRDVRILDSSTGHGVVHEHVPGLTLSEWLAENGPRRLSAAWGVVRSLLEALEVLHDHRLIHGDLRPENIVVGDDGVVLLDVGTDALRGRAAPSRYTAPEQLRGSGIGPASDVYAFGLVLYELIGGRPAISARSPADLLVAHLTESPDPLSFVASRGWVSGELDEFVMQLVDRDPAARPKDAGAVLDVMESLVQLSVRREKNFSLEEFDQRVSVLLADPADDVAAAVLESGVEEGANPEHVAEAFRLAAEQLEPKGDTLPKKLRLLARAAALYETSALDLDAAELTYRRLLELDSGDEAARTSLERLLARRGKHDELVELLIARSELATTPFEKARAFARMGSVLDEDVGDQEQALIAFTHALCSDPSDDRTAMQVERLAGKNDQAWNDVLTHASEVVAGDAPIEQKNRLLSRMGGWYRAVLHRPDFAMQCFQAILFAEPGNDRALAELVEILRAAQQWRELVTVLLARADAAGTPALARDMRADAARIIEERLGEVDHAAALYERVLAEDAAHELAGGALARIYEERSNWPAFVSAVGRHAAALRGEARAQLLCRVALVEEQKLGDQEAALRRYSRATREVPDYLEALQGLERLYQRTGRFTELLDVLDRQLELAVTPQKKKALLSQIAAIHAEQFLDHDKAAQALWSLLDVDGSDREALGQLAYHLRARERWPELSQVYERHAAVATDPNERVEKLLALGKLLGEQLRQPDLSLASYETVLEIEPGNPVALNALTRLRAATGDELRAVEALEQLAEASDAPEQKAEHYVRAARMLAARGDLAAALDRYNRALSAVEGHPEALRGQREVYLAQGDATAAARALEREIGFAKGDSEKARLCAELAELFRDELLDLGRAEGAAERALEHEPSNLEANRLLADIAFEQQRWPEATRHFERVVERKSLLEARDALKLLERYTEALAQSGREERALEIAEQARDLAPDDVDAGFRVAELAFHHSTAERAAETARRVLDELSPRLEMPKRAQVLFWLGDSLRRQGHLDGASDSLQRALGLDPDLDEALASLAELHRSREDWHALEQVLERRLGLAQGDARVTLLLELGAVAETRRHEPARAAERYLAVLAERPGERRALLKLVRLYSEEKDWGKVLQVIMELADAVRDPGQRAKYLHAAARIAAMEMNDQRTASKLLDQVLALDPELAGAAEEAVELHVSKGDYEGARRVLERQLQSATVERRAPLLDRLAELYIAEMRTDDAVQALQAAHALDPTGREREQLLAELYSSDPARYLDLAVQAQQAILAREPYRIETYQALWEIYEDAKVPDGQWCVAQALTYLNRGSPEQAVFFKKNRRGAPVETKASLTGGEWARLVRHPDASALVTDIFTVIQPAVIAAQGQRLEDLGYDYDATVDPDEATGGVIDALKNAAAVLGMALPTIVHDPERKAALWMPTSRPQVLVVGRAGMESRLPALRAAFAAATHLAYMRAGLTVRYYVPSVVGLKAWLLAATTLITPRLPVPGEVEQRVVEARSVLDKRLTGPMRDRLAEPVSELLKQGGMVDLTRWVNAVDFTSDRAGLLACDDLYTAARAVRDAGDRTTGPAVGRRLEELIRYSVSSAYLEARAHLRIGVEPKRLRPPPKPRQPGWHEPGEN